MARAELAASVKQYLAALRMLFEDLVVGQVLAYNPAHAVRLKVRDYEHQCRRAYSLCTNKGGQHRRAPVHSRAAEALGSKAPSDRVRVG